jgi:hypothetical protein
MGQICEKPEDLSVNISYLLEEDLLKRANPIRSEESLFSIKSKDSILRRANQVNYNSSSSMSSFKSVIKNINSIKENIESKNSSKENILISQTIKIRDEFPLTNKEIYLVDSQSLGSKSLFISSSLENENENYIKKNSKNSFNLYTNFKLNEEIFEELLREKLTRSIQIENYNNSDIIHLKELIIPFPDDDINLEKIQDDDYINEKIEEIKTKISGKYFIKKFHIDTATKEDVIKFISCDNNDCGNDSFYLEENVYIGINFKLINNDYYVIYFLYAEEFK